MDYQFLFATAIPTLAIIIVGFILREQIKKQKELLQNYKDYISATDWKKVQEHYEHFQIPSIKKELEALYATDINNANKLVEQREREIEKLMFATTIFLASNKEFAKAYVHSFEEGDLKQALLKSLDFVSGRNFSRHNNQQKK